MSIHTKAIAGIGVLAVLAAGSWTFADSNRNDKGVRAYGPSFTRMEHSNGKNSGAHRKEDKKDVFRSLSGVVSAKSGSTITVLAKNNAVFIVNAENAQFKNGGVGDIAVGDAVRVWGKVEGAHVSATHVFEIDVSKLSFKSHINHVVSGVVTSINGSLFVVDPFSKKTPTTTVSTNASTTYKVNGQATTSSALGVGSKVILLGTTTATSTSGNTFSVSVVHIITKGFGHLKHWFWWR